ncbi:hypothetical protein [Bifidobacterium tsurumiense]|uniref:Uncharacterized protein n=1 Tax=Bifidobacterium tsurumiense TaxID=356829 RepID=A0A087E8C2_9BIFI|nr:hypothetical protein [Bifidobacterium tsurumiense]KFJ04023.1 hypothetical protein BITS_1852 [Bifidobacterium tsurumiense]
MVQDIEDGLDQAMIQAWQNTAMSLRQLAVQLRQDVRQSKRERRATMDRESVNRERQRRMLEDWEKQNRRRLNDGLEQTLRATVLHPDFLKETRPSDVDLLKSWSVTDWLSREGEPGFAAELRRAQDILRSEWRMRHGSNIEVEADRMTNSVTIYHHGVTGEMQETMEQLRKGGVMGIDVIELKDSEYRHRFGDKARFHVVSRMSGEWDGWDRDMITQAVLVNPLSGNVDELADRVGMLREIGLPESSGADNTAVGDEPSSVRETGAYESQPAAPMADTESPRHAKPVEPGSSDEAPMSLDEPEEWHGPDMFGAYSVPQEAGLAEDRHPDGNAAFTPETVPDRPHTAGTRRKA